MAVRNLVARAGVDLSNWEKGLGKMEKDLNKMSKKMEAMGKAMTAAFTLPVVAIATLSLKTVAFADELATTAVAINMSAEALQRWRYIAKQTDVDTEVLTKGFVKFRSAIGDRLLGQTNNATKALDSLGLTMSDLKGKSSEENFETLIRKLSSIKDKTLQAAYANEIFGDRIATDIIPLLAAGGDAIDTYSKEFEKIGYLSNQQVDKLAKFDNEMNRVKTTFSVVGAELGTAFLPMLQQLITILEVSVVPIMRALTSAFSILPGPIQAVVTSLLLLVATFGPILIIYSKLIKLKAILVGWYATVLAAQKAETAAAAGDNVVKNIGVLTMIKTIALHGSHKIALIGSAVATGVMSAVTWGATAAQVALNAAFYASPLGWIALLVIAIVAVFILLWNKLKGFKAFWINLWETIKNAFISVVNFIIDGINLYLSAWKFLINSTIQLTNKLIGVLNKIPGVNIALIPTLSADALQIPKLASGGIAYGNTIANVGEYANARSNPEVIAPLDKLKGMLGDNGEQRITINIGDDLIFDKVVKKMGREWNLTAR